MKKKMSYSEKKALHDRMWRLKINITCEGGTYGLNVRKKVYFRDQEAAEAARAKYESLPDGGISGATTVVNVEGYKIKSKAIIAYEIKLREPDLNPEEIPDKLDDDDDD